MDIRLWFVFGIIFLWFGSIALMCFLSVRRQNRKDKKNIELLIQKDRWRQNEN